MDLLNNKPLMLLIFIVIAVAAGIIAHKNATKPEPPIGIESIAPDKTVLMKCKNADCAVEYEISQKEYFETLQELVDPMKMDMPGIACKECGQIEAYRAIKCTKCGEIFFYGQSEGFVDKCTECGFSPTEEARNQ